MEIKYRKGTVFKCENSKLKILDTLYEGKTEIECKCLKCEKTSMQNISDLEQGIAECNVCKRKREAKERDDRTKKALKKAGFKYIKTVEFGFSTKIRVECNVCKKMYDLDFKDIPVIISGRASEVNKITCKCYQKGRKLRKDFGAIKYMNDTSSKSCRPLKAPKDYEGFSYINVEHASTRTVNYIYVCRKCGEKISIGEAKILNADYKPVCNRCKKLKVSRPIELDKDWTGEIKNGLEVTKLEFSDEINDNIVHCKCLKCKKKFTMSLAYFLYSDNVICDECADKFVTLQCPLCNEAHINTTFKKLYKDKTINYGTQNKPNIAERYVVCEKKKRSIPMSELVGLHNSLLRIQLITQEFKDEEVERMTYESDGIVPKLIISNKGYTGTDGQYYKYCSCSKHKKRLALSEYEIDNYNHEFCREFRMML